MPLGRLPGALPQSRRARKNRLAKTTSSQRRQRGSLKRPPDATEASTSSVTGRYRCRNQATPSPGGKASSSARMSARTSAIRRGKRPARSSSALIGRRLAYEQGRVCEGTGRFPHWFEEGARGGNMGFPHGSEPKASDGHAATRRPRNLAASRTISSSSRRGPTSSTESASCARSKSVTFAQRESKADHQRRPTARS
jgi:hypothetical protein